MELVSIILPVYNGSKYLKRCINSILKQTYENIELIVIDDGSKDNSLEIINSFKDKRLKVFTQKNMGVAKTRNKGISLSKGEYIFFVDNDDYLDENYIKTYMSYRENDVVIGGYKRRNEDKIILDKHILNNPFSKFENMAPWGRMIKKSVLTQNDIKFFHYSIGEDIIFNLKLYSKCFNIKTIDYSGYNWFFNKKSVSNTSQKKFDTDITVLLDEMIKYDVNDDIHYFIRRYKVWYLLFSGKNVSSKDFQDEYIKVSKWYDEKGFRDDFSIKKIFNMEQDLKNKIIVSIFYIIEKFNLIRLFSKFYCKG